MAELFSNDAEIAVISTLLHHPDLEYNTCGVRFFMFSSTANQLIFAEVEDMISRGLTLDISLLITSLSANGKLDKCGGKEYIEYIFALEFPKENFNEYSNIVVSSYRARSFISLTAGVKASNLNLDNIDEAIRKVRDGIDSLVTDSSNGQTQQIGIGASAVYDEIVARTKNPGIRGTPWGFKKLDSVTGGKNEGELWYIAGRPGSGKSAVICNAVLNDGFAGNPCLLFSKEMNYTTLMERFVAIDSGIPITNIRLGLLNQEQLDKLLVSLKRVKELPIYLDTNFMMDDYYIDTAMKKFHTLHGIKTVYIDYMQLVAERDENMVHTLGRISRMLKTNANGLKLSVVALSQLNREVEHRDNKRPIMSDIKQSGSLEEDADLVVGLYRDEYYYKDTKFPGLLEFNILKNRNGPVGSITFDFKAETNKVVG